VFTFPNPVNEKAARTVAAVVALTAALILVTGWFWLLAVLAAGFWARTLTGPTLSPLGRFAMWFAGRFLGEPRHVAGPPKRFAQFVGALCTTTGAVAAIGFGAGTLPAVMAGLMVVFATLESAFAFCAGCRMFALGMRLGLVPEAVCAECQDIWSRPGMDRALLKT
jgi:hypothetical protein